MARALLVADRLRGHGEPAGYLDVLKERLTPDNVEPRPPTATHRDGVTAVVFDAGPAARIRGESICVGTFFGPEGNWHAPGGHRPEGCYALMRSDSSRIELVADAAATHTIWYAVTPDLFIASTSQRAIVMLLGRYEPSDSAVTWMLSSGTLGPDTGWDARLRQVLPGERVVLDRTRWRLAHDMTPIRFEAAPGNDAHHAERLSAALEEVFSHYEFDPKRWAFLLSGGIDSRGLLALLRRREGLKTITWGMSRTRDEALNDACIASMVAEALGFENRFFATDLASEPRDKLIRRFLVSGEGRIASISPFVDGFGVWKTLRDEGVEGAIRGDEAFGSFFVRNEYEARFPAKLTLLTDFLTPAQIDAFGLTPQVLPEHLERHEGETFSQWRDRLYQEHRLPKFLAALSDLQTPYVEVTNPLLSSTILNCVRTLPDHLRTHKRCWRGVAHRESPRVPLARRVAVLPLQRFVSDTSTLKEMLAEIETRRDNDVLNDTFRHRIAAILHTALAADPRERAETKQPNIFSLMAPQFVRETARRLIPLRPTFEPLVFAFRAFIASRMNATLTEDSAILATQSRQRATSL
jgi:hypothetical protein